MQFLSLYSLPRTGKVAIPYQARTEAGFYLALDKVEVVGIDDPAAFLAAAEAVWAVGHPIVPTPPRDRFPKWIVPKALGQRTINDVEREALLVKIEQDAQGIFCCERWYSPPRQNGFVPAEEPQEIFPSGTPFATVIERDG